MFFLNSDWSGVFGREWWMRSGQKKTDQLGHCIFGLIGQWDNGSLIWFDEMKCKKTWWRNAFRFFVRQFIAYVVTKTFGSTFVIFAYNNNYYYHWSFIHIFQMKCKVRVLFRNPNQTEPKKIQFKFQVSRSVNFFFWKKNPAAFCCCC